MKWPNLFLYSVNTGGSITYSPVPQHTWKAGELIRNKHWNNLKDAPPLFKKITITSQIDTTIQFDISYEYAKKILSNGGILFWVYEGETYNRIEYVALGLFKNGQLSGSGSVSGFWDSSLDGYLTYTIENPKT